MNTEGFEGGAGRGEGGGVGGESGEGGVFTSYLCFVIQIVLAFSC